MVRDGRRLHLRTFPRTTCNKGRRNSVSETHQQMSVLTSMLVYGTKLTVQLNLHTTTVMLNVRNDVSGNSRVRVLSASNPKLYLLVL